MTASARWYGLVVLGWALFGGLHGTQLFFGIRAEGAGRDLSYGIFVASRVVTWLTWAALTPVVVWLSRRVPLARRVRPIVIHLVAGALLALVRTVAVVAIMLVLSPWGPPPADRNLPSLYLGMLSSLFHIDLLIYWAIVGVVHALDSRERLRERELHASRVEARLAQAQLTNLRLQLQPHFLFNTLHAIASLVRDGEQRPAVTMIAGLSDLLRYSLDNAGRNVVPLDEELEVVQRYLEIQQTRFSDRLEVTLHVADDTRDAAVPTLLLQPLVENAIRHGIAASTGAGKLDVCARREGESLVIEVLNDGAPLRADWRTREGVGLASTRGRLEQLYGSEASLELENAAPSGVVARVRIPFTKELGDA